MDYGFVLFIKDLAAIVEDQRTNLFVSNSNPLRRSGVRLGSILAPVDQ